MIQGCSLKTPIACLCTGVYLEGNELPDDMLWFKPEDGGLKLAFWLPCEDKLKQSCIKGETSWKTAMIIRMKRKDLREREKWLKIRNVEAVTYRQEMTEKMKMTPKPGLIKLAGVVLQRQ